MCLPYLNPISIEVLAIFLKESILSLDDIAYLIADVKQTEIKYGIRRLREAGLIVKIPNMKDMRRVVYRLAEPDEIHSGLEFIKKSQIPELRQIVHSKRLPVQYQINKIQ